jgi:AcrR family transcriptional regulator
MADAKRVRKREPALFQRQRRGIVTRSELIRSARHIFARDGFEHARIEDIALRARKTRGAFYDNFKDKEDVFLAIFEEDVVRDLNELGSLLLPLPTINERIEALAQYLVRLSNDLERMLLNVEFKLYAIRHPHKRKRLADQPVASAIGWEDCRHKADGLPCDLQRNGRACVESFI